MTRAHEPFASGLRSGPLPIHLDVFQPASERRPIEPAPGGGPAGDVLRLLGGAMRWIARLSLRRRTARALERLPDRLLHDIGVGRADIPQVARNAAAAHLATAGLFTTAPSAANDDRGDRVA